MSIGHEFYICRASYAIARENGAPVVHILDLGNGYMCAETDDGKVLNEGVKGCCKWAVKFNTAQQWLENIKPIDHHSEE